jgi:hypothetical protein
LSFPGLVQGHVVGQDKRAGGRDLQALAHRYTLGLQAGDFLEQGVGGQHHAVADQALHVFTQDAGGDQVQDGFLALDDQGVAGVVTALEAHYGTGLVGQQIDDFAFAFVAPLGAQDYYVFTHGWCSVLNPF